jgi:predicted nucleic acid-binding Zn ribbon protein
MNCAFCGTSIPQGASHCPECKQSIIKTVENGEQSSEAAPGQGGMPGQRHKVRLQKAAQEKPDAARKLLEHTPTVPIENIAGPKRAETPATLLDELPTSPIESVLDNAPTVPTPSIAGSAQPATMRAVFSSGRPVARAVVTARQRSRRSIMTFVLICCLAVLFIGGIAAVAFLRDTTQVILPPSVLDGSPTPIEGPSGQVIDLTAGGILSNVNLASRIDNNYLPVIATTTFVPGQRVYLTFVVNSQNQPGYIMVKWYANNRYLSQDQMAHNPQDNVAFFSYVYHQPAHATAELYWCSNASCSDARLAHVILFTVQ